MARKKSSDSKGIKCKNMMYTQQVVHMPMTMDELKAEVKRLNPTRYAIIEHINEVDEHGNLIEPHVHVMMCFANARYLTSIAKKLGDKPQYIQAWDERANNGFDPLKFYKEMFGPYALTIQTDNFGQLWRRLLLVIKMDYDSMEVTTMDEYGFHAVSGTSVPNPYSAKNRPAPKVNGLDLYRSMLDSAAPVEDPPRERAENPFLASKHIKADDKPIKFDGT